jgi:hypothetical protein
MKWIEDKKLDGTPFGVFPSEQRKSSQKAISYAEFREAIPRQENRK